MTIITKEQAEAPGAAAVIQQVRTGVGGQTSSLQLIYTFNYFSILNTGRENVHALTLKVWGWRVQTWGKQAKQVYRQHHKTLHTSGLLF